MEPVAKPRISRSGSENRQRRRMLTIRFTDEEFAKLDQLAHADRLSHSAYIRRCTLGEEGPRSRRPVPNVNSRALGKALGDLNRLGSNLNQIARELNQQKYLADGGFISRALRNQDYDAFRAIEAVCGIIETTRADLTITLDAVRHAIDDYA